MTIKLLLLRHGQSTWNEKNLFTGWVDVGLSDLGRSEAEKAGRLMAESGLLPDVLHTSVLRRAITTANIALDTADRHWIPVRRHWRLNERHYGSLQGLNKAQVAEKVGEEQVQIWRRSYSAVPPPMREEDMRAQQRDPRYDGVETPASESLETVIYRLLPYWDSDIIPDLKSGRTVLVVAHGNSLRGLIKELDQMTDDEIIKLNLPTGVPILYELDEDLRPLTRGGRKLDELAAERS
ncbi:hypothetical protein VTK73DRAFT_813 [Phialemonium thermophilum]|uniref:Phosphoglycerate mutase n=1 Tax=Phialemonium thermophilum TaxID=223376 RepID=A0ABR3XCZ9_9PEZI